MNQCLGLHCGDAQSAHQGQEHGGTRAPTQQLSAATQLLWSVWSKTGLTVLGPIGGHHQFPNLSQLSHALAGQEQLRQATGRCWCSIPAVRPSSTCALSRQLRQQGTTLTDELTPKQQQDQKALDPDRIALQFKSFCTLFRHGNLWYLDQVCLGSATQGSPPGSNLPADRAPLRGPSGRPRQTPRRSGGSIPAGPPRANRVVAAVPASCQAPPCPAGPAASPPSPSYAFVAGSDPVAARDTGPAAPVGPAAGPTSAAAAAPSCTPTATPPVSPVSSPAGPPAPTNPQ